MSLSPREEVERTADRIRDDLLLTLQELDKRRGRALDLRYQLRQHATEAKVAGGGLLLAVGAGVALVWWGVQRKKKRLPLRRWQSLQRAWSHPDQVASKSKERPFLNQIGQKVAIIVVTAFATTLARRSANALLDLPDEEKGLML